MSFEVRCDTCNARFALGDDLYERKVKGRLVTIKCKKCGAGISVDGTGVSGAAAALPPVEEVVPSDDAPTEIRERGPSTPDAATPTVPLTGVKLPGTNELEPTPTVPLNLGSSVWLVSFSESDDRELDAGKIAEALGKGEIDESTIVWRDGMADWLPIASVPELANALAKGKAHRSPAPDAARTGGFLGTGMKLGGDAKTGAPRPEGSTAKAPEPPKVKTPEPPKAKTPEPPKAKTPEPLKARTPEPPKARSPEPPKATAGGGAGAAADEDDEDVPISLDPESLDPESLRKLQEEDGGAARALSPGTLGSPKAPKPPPRAGAEPGKPSLPTPKKAPKPPTPKKGGQELKSLSGDEPRAEERADEDILGLGGGAPIIAPVDFDAPVGAPSLDIASLGVAAEAAPPSSGKKKKRKKASGETSDAAASAAPPLATASDAGEPAPKAEEKRGSPVVWLLVAAAVAVGGWFVLFKKDGGEPSATETTAHAPASPATPQEPEKLAAPPEPEPTAPPAEQPSSEEPSKPEPPSPASDPVGEASRAPSKAEPSKAEPSKAEPSKAEAVKPEAAKPEAAKPEAAKPEAAKPEPPKEEPKKEVAMAGEFDSGAARSALAAAAGTAAGCRKADDPSGTARVTVTFAPSGRVTSAVVSGPPFAGTATGGCIASAMRAARVPPFSGSPVTVGKTVLVN